MANTDPVADNAVIVEHVARRGREVGLVDVYPVGAVTVGLKGEHIVFQNPHWLPGGLDEYIVKRVIAFPGERVTVSGGVMKVYNQENPEGFLVDEIHPGATSPTAGEVDTVVPEDELFVAGDHRQEGFSLDSRDGLGTIPYRDLIGPVAMRIFPFTHFELFSSLN
jgi:signal peptidase I